MTKLGEIMRAGSFVTVAHDATVLAAARSMAVHGVGVVGVLEGNRLVGVLSGRDVVRRVVARGIDPGRARTEDAMTRAVVVADAEEGCAAALSRMEEAGIGHLPVMSEGHVLSVVSLRELVRAGREDAEAAVLGDQAEV